MEKLNFTKSDNMYVASIVSQGQPIHFKIKRAECGDIICKALYKKNTDIRCFRSAGKNFMTSIDVPDGTEIIVGSKTEVLYCEYGV